jgi:phosphopantothenoylcysteine decarboxylase/phosphopantothenate--cysteine ligase
LDEVRRLTNRSTGRLGAELASFLTARGHEVVLLVGEQATWPGPRRAARVATFTTAADLRQRLRALAGEAVRAVFHAAAVSDFAFGKTWLWSADRQLTEVQAGKLPSRAKALLAELVATPKIIAELRDWFPGAKLVGWKYEVDGSRAEVLRLAEKQIAECRTDACVANGPAYGDGFGLVRRGGECRHVQGARPLFQALEELMRETVGTASVRRYRRTI